MSSSRAFTVRRDSGTCDLCEAGFAKGNRAFYMTARINDDGALRNLTREEKEEVKKEVKKAFRRSRRAGRKGRGNLNLSWLWERMVHVECASGHGFEVPTGETRARRGTRTTGWNHKAGDAEVSAEDRQRVREAGVRAREANARALEAKRQEAAERGRRELTERLAREQAAINRRAGIVENPSVERFKQAGQLVQLLEYRKDGRNEYCRR